MKQVINEWLYRLRWIPITIIAAAVLQVVVWAAQDEPPFHVISAKIIPPSEPGGSLKVEGRVYRDLSRECYVRIVHWIEDSAKYRHFLPTIGLTHESIKAAELANPGITRYNNKIDPGVAPGPATYHAENAYVCNPWHLVWPIVVSTDIPFEVTQ